MQVAYVAAYGCGKALVASAGAKHAGDLPHLATHAGASFLHVCLLKHAAGDGAAAAVGVGVGQLTLGWPPVLGVGGAPSL